MFPQPDKQKISQLWLVIYATSAAFMTYFCMYAFRKPFTVGSFEQDQVTPLLDFKVALVIAQVLGYALSKFIGIKVVSEISANKRAISILLLVLTAEVALVLLAILPGNWKLLAMFCNGLPLGIIWGLVFSYLEGRRVTEVLGAGLCVSFIVSSGIVKSVGQFLILDMGVNEYWMPAVTGLLFLAPLFISVYFLSKTPPPNAEDEAQRKKRELMSHQDRLNLFFSLRTRVYCHDCRLRIIDRVA